MQSHSTEERVCHACGAPLQPEHRFCPSCGAAVSPETEPALEHQSDPSSLETSRFEAQQYPTPPAQKPSYQQTTPPGYQQSTTLPPDYQDAGHPTWGTPETIVQPERGNRTLWIILGIIAFVVLICCCILPLGLMAVSSADSSFQDELRTLATMRYL